MMPRVKKLRTCDTCGKQELWNDNWSWYGSWNDEEDGKPLIFACSDACKQPVRKARKMLAEKQGKA